VSYLPRVADLLKRFKKNQFWKNITIIAGGTAFAQAMSVLFSPIITRLYLPGQYGVLSTYNAVLGLLAISATLDYQKAIPIADDDEKAMNLVVLSMFVLTITTFVILVAFIFFGEFFLELLDAHSLLSYRFFIPLGVFFTGTYQVLLHWGLRFRDYRSITRTKFSQSIISNITKIVFGVLHWGPVGLILGAILGQSGGITTLGIPVIRNRVLLHTVTPKQIGVLAKRYKNFPLYSAPSNYVYTAAANLLILFLASLYGSTVTGLFGLANSIVNLPIGLIGNSVAQVFYSEMARIGRDNPLEIKRQAINLVKKLAILALIPFLILFLIGPSLFAFIFGNQWYDSGIYARLISVMAFFHFIILPLGRVLEILERQKEGLFLNIFRLVLLLLLLFIVKYLNLSSYQMIGLYSILMAIMYVVLFIVVVRTINHEIQKMQ